jgi:3-oxoacyl-[acyl-carrier-protein] synthase II
MDTSGYASKIGGEVRDYDAAQYFSNSKEARRVDRYAALAMGAAKMAVADSGLDPDKLDLTRVGVMVGSGIGGLATLEKNHTACLTKSPSRVSPFTIPMMISNIASGLISMEYGFGGPNMSIVTACATANNSVGEAWRIIKFGDADAFLAGGAEASFTPMGLAGFGNMKALSTRNDEPQRASRPFDVGRDGFVMGEGIEGVALQMDRNTNPMFPSGSQHSASLHFHPFSGHGKMITPPCSKKQATTAAGNHRCDARAYAPSSQSGKKDLVRPELSKRLQICPCARM